MSASHIPKGLQAVTPYFTVNGAKEFIAFLTTAYGAREKLRFLRDDGSVAHSALDLCDCVVEVSDARPEYPASLMAIHLYVKDVDDIHRRAVEAGAASQMEPVDQPYGERGSFVKDKWGNSWYLATHTGDVPIEQIEERMNAKLEMK